MPFHWGLFTFEALYESILIQDTRQTDLLIRELSDDLKDLNATYPRKSDSSRNSLETGKIKLSTDEEFEVNKDFIVSLIQLSDELNLDELVSAELVYHASASHNLGTSIVDSAKANFYLRRQNILSIASYLFNAHSDINHVNLVISVDNLFKSFQVVEEELLEVKNMIKRSKLLGIYGSIHLQQNIKFRRDFLYKEHEMLGEVLLGLVTRKKLSVEQFIKNYNILDKYDPDDLFMIHYLPGLFSYCSQISQLTDIEVKKIYKTLIKQELSNEDNISNKPMKLAVILVFITYFTQWCNEDPSRSKEFEFESSCSVPMASCIALGAIEQLMCVAADTTGNDDSVATVHPFYDFRSLLQKHIPKLFPKQILDIDEQATILLKRKLQEEHTLSVIDDDSVPPIYLHSTQFQISSHFISLFIPLFTHFLECFITTSAFMLTKLRDSEEDGLLSSDNFDLDQISTKLDLERFYMTVFYLYSSRPALASRFWEKTSPLFGFIKWSSSSNSALMRSTFCLMLSAFASGEHNAIETYNFLQSNSSMGTTSATFIINNTSSNINWSSIYEDLIFYNKALSEPAQDEQLQLYSSFAGRTQLAPIAPELGEDSILFITGYFQVISQVALNNEQTKKELFESDDMELPNILKSFLSNNTPLTGACLLTLRSLISDNGDIRNKIWEIVENWIFKNTKARQYISKDGSKLNIKKIFAQSLKSFEDILGFVNLLHGLLVQTPSKNFTQYTVQFPLGLGLENGRKQGIYPYIEFLMEEVFASSTQSYLSIDERFKLQKPLLSIISNVLNSIKDKNLIEFSQHCHLSKVDNLFKSPLNFKTFAELEPSSLVMNYLFDEKVYSLLLDIVSVGIDEIADKPSDSSAVETLSLGLEIIERILSLQSFFIETAMPLIKDSSNPSYVPSNFGTHGLRTFYDAILFKLPLVANLLLYIGSEHVVIAKTSLEILSQISESPRFNESANNISSKTILLTTFETIDESERIKNAFIDQLSTEVTNDAILTTKLKLLKFLDKNLSNTDTEPTIAHFLLGFETKGYNNLITGDLDSKRSLFKILIYILNSSVDSLQDGQNIIYAPIKLAAIVMEILLKLCKNSISRYLVLPKLRDNPDFNLFIKLLSSNITLDSTATLFEGLKFDDVLSNQNILTTESQGIGALIAFIQYRKFVSQYLLIELSSISTSGSLSLRTKYIKALINSDAILDGSPKILGFLDILEFNFVKIVEPFEMKLFGEFDYNYLLKQIKLKDYDLLSSDNSIYDMSAFHDFVELNAIELIATRVNVNSTSTLADINKEAASIEKYLINYSAFNDFKALQLEFLKSWTFLIQFVISQGQVDKTTRTTIILEVFQAVLPKINDYLAVDISFAEELVSLCVLLYDQSNDSNGNINYHGLLPIFQTCINGLLSTHSTPEIRSDFYVLANKYLEQVENSKELVSNLLKSLNLEENELLLKKIFDDSILGESSARVTSLLFLEKLVKISAQLDKLILQSLIRNDYLSLLVRSISRTDDLLASCSKPSPNEKSVTLYGLLYELTALKTTLYFLIRVAETRVGAYKLVQSDVFNIIKNSTILKIDPDLGVDLRFDELNHDKNSMVMTNLSLDTPLRLPSEYHDQYVQSSSTTTISLFEILVPIFQLLNAVAISMGPSNKPINSKIKDLLAQVEKLIVGVLKRDAILEEKIRVVNVESNNVYHNDVSLAGLKELIKQLTLLYSLIEE